ncbi:MAG: M48 family metallopeptidase [Prosthecochloris sp.]|nr:M48 family metallopeptidase [Prosthecochloris sp.]
MFKRISLLRLKLIMASILLPLLVTACTTVPITGRSQLNLVPSSTMMSLSSEQYGNFLRNNRAILAGPDAERVKRVGSRIRTAVETYFRQRGLSVRLNGYSWQFNLIDNDTPNAWCMPGGRIAVYSGILPYTLDDNGLAVVIAHEIAHAVAEHGNERMSQSLLTQMGGMALSSALGSQPEKTRQLWLNAFGVGSQIAYVLPYSRTQEYEADRLGLVFMAMAGYNPSAALDFWERMMAKKDRASMPEFLSTHPSDEARIRYIRTIIPEAMKYYR